MLVRCIYNERSSIPLEHQSSLEDDKASYSFLDIGGIYFVFGIMFKKIGTEFLTCRTGGISSWVPSVLFDIVDNSIPSDWGIRFTKGDERYSPLYDRHGINCLIGYDLLVNDPSHYDGILDGEYDDMVTFFKEMMRYECDLQEQEAQETGCSNVSLQRIYYPSASDV